MRLMKPDPVDPLSASEDRIAAGLAAIPDGAACLLATNAVPWAVAYRAAPRLLYRFHGDPFRLNDFLRLYRIGCIVVFTGADRDGVYPVKEANP